MFRLSWCSRIGAALVSAPVTGLLLLGSWGALDRPAKLEGTGFLRRVGTSIEVPEDNLE